jgi:hypothetical protein
MAKIELPPLLELMEAAAIGADEADLRRKRGYFCET